MACSLTIVKVRLIGSIKDIMGCAELNITLKEDSSLIGLLDILAQEYGGRLIGRFAEYQWRHVSIFFESPILITLNCKALSEEDVSEVQLKDGDIVSLLPWIDGG